MRAVSRPVDFLTRYGGEEFAIVLPTTGREGACVMAERLRRTVADSSFLHRAVTVSIGAATLDLESADPSSLIAAADEALYAAKRGGRNRVVHALAPVGAA